MADSEPQTFGPDFEKAGGLIPVIAQDAETGEVFMLAYMNALAFQKTVETGQVHYWSRSRNELWRKGGSSGHVQAVKDIRLDCDGDAILVKIEQIGGAACHTGHRSCFHYRWTEGDFTIEGEKVFDPGEVYGK